MKNLFFAVLLLVCHGWLRHADRIVGAFHGAF